MKKAILICVLSVMVLAGCGGRRQSDNKCLYCNYVYAYDYQIDGQTVTFCEDCYEKEMEQNNQVKADLKSDI